MMTTKGAAANKDPMQAWRLNGKVALVTGASSGLGKHFAWTLARAGAHVVLCARREEILREEARLMSEQGLQASVQVMDVTQSESVRAAFEAVSKTVGIPEIVVSNAGLTVAKPALEQSEDDWNTVLDANLKGTWLVNREAAKHLVGARQAGSLINIASLLGARVAASVAPYAISKAGVIQATKALALEWARYGIRVNALLPGYVRTPLNAEFLDSEAGEKLRLRIPMRRFCTLEDLEGPLLLLASDAGRAMTGATLSVDQGHLVSGV